MVLLGQGRVGAVAMTTEVQKAGALLGVFQRRSAPVGLHEREVPGLGQPKRTCENRNSNQDVNFNTTESDHITTHTYIHTYIHTYRQTYIHTYIHQYIHTYIHIYIYNRQATGITYVSLISEY